MSELGPIPREGTITERAITVALEHRHTHEVWRDWWRAHPPRTYEERLVRSNVGGIGHHQAAIRRYNLILRALGYREAGRS